MDISNVAQSTLEGSLLRNDGIRLVLQVAQLEARLAWLEKKLELDVHLRPSVPLIAQPCGRRVDTPVRLIWKGTHRGANRDCRG